LKRSFLYLYYLIITFFCSLHKEFAKLVFLLTITKYTAEKFHGIFKKRADVLP
jgi:hypothetical protein